MREYFLGIDIGTSSVKGLARDKSGDTVKAKRTYAKLGIEGWRSAIIELLSELAEITAERGGTLAAVAFSSQVGTYIVNDKDVIGWQSSAGHEELAEIKKTIPSSRFLSEIGMNHPDIISYPLPRLLYIQKKYGKCEVLQPKDYFIRELTGNSVTDYYSLRGLVNLQTETRADGLLRDLGITCSLPESVSPLAEVGVVTPSASKTYPLKTGLPIYAGCNDFFAGLFGMGAYETGGAFDLSGTSEHLGFISDKIENSASVSGKYFNGYCSYGGTKSSGVCCDFAINNFGTEGLTIDGMLEGNPPVFLPYLNGERAPIYDENARGTFFGIGARTDKRQLAYSVLEGVVFSLFDIASDMKMPKPERLICGGGSARNSLMSEIKAELFDCSVVCVAENDVSALGACMLAMVGLGYRKDMRRAILHEVRFLNAVQPSGRYREKLLKRFEIYKDLYSDLKGTFKKFNSIE